MHTDSTMTSTRDQAVSAFLRSLDVALFRALGESARVAVLEVLLRHPDSDVASIAAELPQDGSVIARHLQILERAGLVRSRKAGRHRHYSIDGNGLLRRIGAFQKAASRAIATCCPPGSNRCE
jgi:DNA-binding transcriptional ArsR family regulator